MTFTEALRLLAEKEPLKYDIVQDEDFYGDPIDMFRRINVELIPAGQRDVDFPIEGTYATQDDIDAILAEVGWEYAVVKEWAGEARWQFYLGKIGDSVAQSKHYSTTFPSKIAAARAALIAVVEKVYGTAIREGKK